MFCSSPTCFISIIIQFYMYFAKFHWRVLPSHTPSLQIRYKNKLMKLIGPNKFSRCQAALSLSEHRARSSSAGRTGLPTPGPSGTRAPWRQWNWQNSHCRLPKGLQGQKDQARQLSALRLVCQILSSNCPPASGPMEA